MCDTPGFAQSGRTIPVIPGNLELIRNVVFYQEQCNLNFGLVLYFLPCRGSPERADGVLNDEIAILQHYFGENIWKRMVVVVTAPQRFTQKKYFDLYVDPIEDCKRPVQNALKSVLQRYKIEAECQYLQENECFRFLSHDCIDVKDMLSSFLKGDHKGGLSFSRDTCAKCSKKVTFKISGKDDACTVTEDGHIPTTVAETGKNFCHPKFKRNWKAIPYFIFWETCSYCHCRPGTPGCLRVGEIYKDKLQVDHETWIDKLQL